MAQGTEPWRIPEMSELPDLTVNFATDPETFKPYRRDPNTLARMWAVPGTPNLEHRIGGLEKEDITGLVSHDPLNHQKMVELRQKKVDEIANDIPLAEVEGEQSGDLLVVAWGSVYGPVKTAFDTLREQGHKISYTHLKYIRPFPKNLGEILSRFERVVVPEMNMGQLADLLQSKFLRPVLRINKVQGMPFKAKEIETKLLDLLNNKGDK